MRATFKCLAALFMLSAPSAEAASLRVSPVPLDLSLFRRDLGDELFELPLADLHLTTFGFFLLAQFAKLEFQFLQVV